MKKKIICSICMLLLYFSAFTQIKLSAKIGYTSTNVFMENTNTWISNGFAQLSADTGSKEQVKANVTVQVNNTGFILDRAYVKFRLPWIVKDTSVRLSFGKMPLSWGKGMYFNAGDSIFGYLPSMQSESPLPISDDEYRTATEWMAVAYFPIANFSYAECVVLPPLSLKINHGESLASQNFTGAVRDNGGSVGTRLVFEIPATVITSIEASYMLSRKLSIEDTYIHTVAVNIDGTLFFDYTACAAIQWSGKKLDLLNGSNFPFIVSGSIFKNWYIPFGENDMPLSVRFEGAYMHNTGETELFPLISLGITDTIHASLCALLQLKKETYTPSCSFTWKAAIQGLQITATGFMQFNNAQNAKISSGGFSFSGIYRF